MTPVQTPVRRGVVFPQGSIAGDPDSVREYIEGVTALGYDHVLVPDHVLGVDPSCHPGWSGVYDVHDMFHEPLVLFGFIAAFSQLELVAGVVVLPQRQAALVAKQAAQVDLLCRGRLRLGVGTGWNAPEFAGLGADFASRGRRIDEQIAVMRELWTRPSVDFAGSDHQLAAVGIAPLPVQRPIPVWIGAERAPRAFRRVGRSGDGWMAMGAPTSENAEGMSIIREAAIEAGRDPEAIGVEAWLSAADGDTERMRDDVRGWVTIGATHVAVNTRGRGRQSLQDHLRLAADARSAFE